MATTADILSSILDTQYQEDLSTSPWLMGAKSMGTLPQQAPNSNTPWYEALAQGLLFGMAQGGMAEYGKLDAREQKAENAAEQLKMFNEWAGAPDETTRTNVITRMAGSGSPVLKETAAKLQLAQIANDMEDRLRTKTMQPAEAKIWAEQMALLTGQDAGELYAAGLQMDRNFANITLQRYQQDKIKDPKNVAARSAAAAVGGVQGKIDSNADIGRFDAQGDSAAKAAMADIRANLAYQKWQQVKALPSSIPELLRQDNPSAAFAAITLFAKGTDPQTGVREGERKAVEDAMSIIQKFSGQISKSLENKSPLPPEVAGQFNKAMRTFVRAYEHGAVDAVKAKQLSIIGGNGGLPVLGSFVVDVPEFYKPAMNEIAGAGRQGLEILGQSGGQATPAFTSLRENTLNRLAESYVKPDTVKVINNDKSSPNYGKFYVVPANDPKLDMIANDPRVRFEW